MRSGAALQAILDEQGITHIQLADRLGISSQAVDARCGGKRVMRVDTLSRTFGALGYRIVACPKAGDGPEFELDG